jgi:PAS domain S-box-containing protein
VQDSRRLEAKQSQTLMPAFIAVLAMMAGLIVYGIYHLSTINNHVQKISQEQIAIWDMVTDMRFAARERILSLTRIIATDDPFVREEEWMKFNDQASVFIENRQRLLAQNLSNREFALLARQGELTGKATAIQDEIIALAMGEESTKAHSLLTEEGIPAQDAVLDVLHQLYAMQEREIEKARHQVNGAYHHARLLMGSIGLFALLLGCIIAFVVTRQNRQHRDQLVKEKTLAQITLHSIADGVISTDHSGHIVHINTKAEELLGVSAASAYGMTSKQLLRLAYEDHSNVDVDPITATIMSRSKQHSISPMLLNNQDGTQHVIEYTVAPIIEHGHLHGAILVFHDVTELHVLTEQLQYHASHDALTGLINRREFEHRLQMSIETAKV